MFHINMLKTYPVRKNPGKNVAAELTVIALIAMSPEGTSIDEDDEGVTLCSLCSNSARVSNSGFLVGLPFRFTHLEQDQQEDL